LEIKKIAVIGAGNGGQAIAGYAALKGYEVSLFDRNEAKVKALQVKGSIELRGQIKGEGHISRITYSIGDAVVDADLVMITTVANAHAEVAKAMSPYVKDGQIIILNPGRTCGALVFKQALNEAGCNKRYYLGEAQTLVYACRIIENGVVNVIGVKHDVLLAALPASDTDLIIEKINPLYPCFIKTDNVLRTGLENIGAIFHPCVCLFNAATIERQNEFYFYRDKFYPLDEIEFSKDDSVNKDGHNHLFTMSFAVPFTVLNNGSENFEITTDDDTFVYIDDKLVIDMGGIHGALAGRFSIHEDGEVYAGVGDEDLAFTGVRLNQGEAGMMRIFHADRDSDESVFGVKFSGMNISFVDTSKLA
jgi:fibro-slime domain-containing protein